MIVSGFEKFNPLYKSKTHKYTNKDNLINELDVARNLFQNLEKADAKEIVECLFCLNQMITRYLIDFVCKNKVFEILKNDKR